MSGELDPAASTFAERLKETVGGKYDPTMRRSIQTVVLYEAHRCLEPRIPSLRPFQRKIALFDTSCDIVNTLEFIPVNFRNEIMYRTASGKLPLSPDLAWRRMKLIDREVQKNIIPLVKPFMSGDKTHQEACDEFIQRQYEIVTKINKPHPPLWEYAHLNIFLAYRMYYKGENVDPDLPPARAPREVKVPSKKPGKFYDGEDDDDEGGTAIPALEGGRAGAGGGRRRKRRPPPEIVRHVTPEERRIMLDEVKTHVELLQIFEGVIPDEDLSKRKQELFMALPPAPLPFPGGLGSSRVVVSPAVAAALGTPPQAKKQKAEKNEENKQVKEDETTAERTIVGEI